MDGRELCSLCSTGDMLPSARGERMLFADDQFICANYPMFVGADEWGGFFLGESDRMRCFCLLFILQSL